MISPGYMVQSPCKVWDVKMVVRNGMRVSCVKGWIDAGQIECHFTVLSTTECKGISDACTSSFYRVARCRRALTAYTAPQPWDKHWLWSNDLAISFPVCFGFFNRRRSDGKAKYSHQIQMWLGVHGFPASTMLVSDQQSRLSRVPRSRCSTGEESNSPSRTSYAGGRLPTSDYYGFRYPRRVHSGFGY